MKKLTAKQLLREVKSLKKQASSLSKPYPIEYENESELNGSIDSVLIDILDGFGYLGATDVIVKGDTAYVKGNFELELDVKKAEPPWWSDPSTKWNKVTRDIVKGLGGQWEGEYFENAYRLWDEGALNEDEPFQVSLNETLFWSKDDWLVYGEAAGGKAEKDIVTKSELSGDYRKDIVYIANAIKKFYQ